MIYVFLLIYDSLVRHIIYNWYMNLIQVITVWKDKRKEEGKDEEDETKQEASVRNNNQIYIPAWNIVQPTKKNQFNRIERQRVYQKRKKEKNRAPFYECVDVLTSEDLLQVYV